LTSTILLKTTLLKVR